MKRIVQITSCAALALCGASAAFAQNGGEPEIIVHPINPHFTGHFQPTIGSSGSAKPALSYHNGPVILTPTAYVIWYGNWNQGNGQDDPNAQTVITDFLNGVGASPYFDINQTYYGVASGVKSFITGNVVFGGQTTSTYSYTPGATITDGDVRAIVQAAITSPSGVPADDNGVYFVLTSSDVKESYNSSNAFCTQYCGYHSNVPNMIQVNGSGVTVKYAFVGNAAQCISACAAQSTGPNGYSGADAMVSVIAHELEEATTDALGTAWYDIRGNENGDKCAWTFGNSVQAANGAWVNVQLPNASTTSGVRDYLIQRNIYRTANGNNYCQIWNSSNSSTGQTWPTALP